MFWSILCVLCSHAMVVNFGYHMPLLYACKHAMIMFCFTLAETVITFNFVLMVPTNPSAICIWCLDVICSLLFVIGGISIGCLITCCSLSLSCSQFAIILTLLMHMLLCYKVAFCIDHIGLILMPMNLNLNEIWSMLSLHELHVKFVLIWFL